nr:M23 family metallopeptidase [Actinomycetota bacterium]
MSLRGRPLAVVAAIAAGMTGAGTWSAAASQCLLGAVCLGDSTTTTAPSSPPQSGQPAGGPSAESQPPPASPGMTLPPPVPPPPPPGSPPPPAVQGGEGDDTAEPPADAGPFPAHLRRLMNSVKRTGANDTLGLLAALAPLAELGIPPEEAVRLGFGRFPVGGEARYSHDWWFPRFGPGWRLHMGTDIFAAMGTPVRAPLDGTVKITNSPLGGLAVYVVAPNRDFWYLAHLAGIPDGLAQGTSVRVGDVVGFTGDSGNARGGSPHVHVEFHPGGGGAVDPKPILDGFLEEAVAEAGAVVERYAAAAAAGIETAPPRSPGVAGGADLGPFEAPRSALLWT